LLGVSYGLADGIDVVKQTAFHLIKLLLLVAELEVNIGAN